MNRDVFSQVLRHIQLIILDLDYLVFDCALLKVQSVRESMISLADVIPQNVRLPGFAEAEDGFRDHGFRWVQHLEIGLDEQALDHLQRAYTLHENRLIESGHAGLFPGMEQFIANCRRANMTVALGADASRDYLMAVSDRHQLDHLFQFTLSTDEFGMGDADEMMLEMMRQAEVNPSETLVLGTRPHTFQAAHGLDLLTIGCGWGLRRHEGLAEADLRAPALSDLFPAIEQADNLALQKLG